MKKTHIFCFAFALSALPVFAQVNTDGCIGAPSAPVELTPEMRDWVDHLMGKDKSALPVKGMHKVSASSWSYPSSTPSTPYAGGSGTEADPYRISTPQQLANLAYMVNNGTTYSGKYFSLTDDLVLNYNVLASDGSLNVGTYGNWKPIGSSSNSFQGRFDGKGHKIRGLYCSWSTTFGVGLFGYVEGATLQNIVLEDSYVYGGVMTGALCGYAGNSSLAGLANFGTVVGNAQYTGGVCGATYQGTTIVGSANYGSVSNQGGSLTGTTPFWGYDTYNTGCVGGVCGMPWDGDYSMSYCYNIGKITGTHQVGGINGGGTAHNGSAVSNCYNMGLVSCSDRNAEYAISMLDTSLNCYYQEGSCTNAPSGTAKSAAAFADGTVLSLLDPDGLYFIQGARFPILKGLAEDAGGDVSTPTVTTTDLSGMPYALYSPTLQTKRSSQVELKVNIKNANAITLWQTDLVLPDGFTIATDAYGEPAISISGGRTSTSRHGIASNIIADGSLRLLCSSSSNKTFTGTDGEVATILLNVPASATDGEYPVVMKNVKLVEANETTHSVDEIVSKISVKNFTLGDVNDDSLIDGADLVGIVNYILETPNPNNIREAADVNRDGEINGTDYVREANAILGLVALSSRRAALAPLAAPAAKVVRSGATAGYSVFMDDARIESGQQVTLAIKMNNLAPVTLWQADLLLPEGITIAEDSFGDPMVTISSSRTSASRHTLAVNTLADGRIRFLCSSANNKTFTGSEGAVAYVTFNVDSRMQNGVYPLSFDNVLLVEPNESKHRFEEASGSVLMLGSSDVQGDVNIDGKVSVTDLAFYLYLFGKSNLGGVDLNGDGKVNVDDMHFIVNGLLHRK